MESALGSGRREFGEAGRNGPTRTDGGASHSCLPPIIRGLPELNESLGRRYLRTGQPLPEPQAPVLKALNCLETPEGLEIQIPNANLASPWKPLKFTKST